MRRKEQHLKNIRFIFIKQVWHHLIHTFLHHNRAKTAGIFFIYACFNQFENIFKEIMLLELMTVIRSFYRSKKRPSIDGYLPGRGAMDSQGISRPKSKYCTGVPPPLDSRRLRNRIANIWGGLKSETT